LTDVLSSSFSMIPASLSTNMAGSVSYTAGTATISGNLAQLPLGAVWTISFSVNTVFSNPARTVPNSANGKETNMNEKTNKHE